MLKVMGIFLVMAGSMGIGWNICRKMDDRIGQLEWMQGLFRIVESEVSYHKVILPEALQKAGYRIDKSLGELMDRISDQMNSGQGVRLETAWSIEVGKWLAGTELKEKEKQIILNFSRCTGYSDGQIQIDEIRRVGTELQEARRLAAEEREDRKRMIFALSVTSGLFAVILLL